MAGPTPCHPRSRLRFQKHAIVRKIPRIATKTTQRDDGRHAAARKSRRLRVGFPPWSFLGIDTGDDRRYLLFLITIATAGWALASYDFNLLVTALPAISKDQTEVGLLAFLI